MKRKILFRGRSEDGTWVYGDLEYNPLYDIARIHSHHSDGTYNRQKIVENATVGQFSGLCDKQGNKIFEGDVVRWDKDSLLYVVVFRLCMFYASVEQFNNGIFGGFPLWFLCEKEQHCSVEGNIYDNNL